MRQILQTIGFRVGTLKHLQKLCLQIHLLTSFLNLLSVCQTFKVPYLKIQPVQDDYLSGNMQFSLPQDHIKHYVKKLQFNDYFAKKISEWQHNLLLPRRMAENQCKESKSCYSVKFELRPDIIRCPLSGLCTAFRLCLHVSKFDTKAALQSSIHKDQI